VGCILGGGNAPWTITNTEWDKQLCKYGEVGN
jgi:hypothetical protein